MISAILRGVLASLLVLAVGACAATSAHFRPGPADAPARGRDVAQRACAGCHAVDRGGASPVARAPSFASRTMRHSAGLDGRLRDLTRLDHHGAPPMALTEPQVRDIEAYIESLGAGDAAARRGASAPRWR
jgi:mono/diheme cytochrome c family protein